MEDRTKAALDALGIPYERVEIDPDFSDTAAFCERYGYPLEQTLNTIIVVGKGESRTFAACVVSGTMKLDVNRTVRKLLGVRKASFASADAMRKLTGMQVGGVTAIGLPKSVPIYADERLVELDWVILGAGSRDAKIKLAPRACFDALGVQLVAGLGLD